MEAVTYINRTPDLNLSHPALQPLHTLICFAKDSPETFPTCQPNQSLTVINNEFLTLSPYVLVGVSDPEKRLS